jgi:sialic acid synthase
MTRQLQIGNITINDDSDCYVIAEIGHNHQGDLKTCKDLFHAAKESGASAVKLQKRDNRSLFTKEMYNSVYSSENAYGDTYGAHREALELDKKEYQELKEYAAELDIAFFATAFDRSSADFLSSFDMPAYKMASGDLTNIPLLRYVAQIGKPMIISTGGGTMDDVRRACDAILAINPQLCVLQCTAGYPPEFSELNLRVIETFRREFPSVVVGLSAHDSGIAMSVAAYVLGARVIEKHFTLNRAMKGTDHAFSLEPVGMRKLVRDLHRTREGLGDGVKDIYPSERKPLFKMGKKLVAARDLPVGHVLTENDIAIKSPNDGLPPYHYDSVLGKVLTKALAEEENLSYEFLADRA